jgi:hypothetical protein
MFSISKAADDLIKELLDADMIHENGSSSWASPLVVVPKAHQVGQFRITIDYRALNKLVKPIKKKRKKERKGAMDYYCRF